MQNDKDYHIQTALIAQVLQKGVKHTATVRENWENRSIL